MSDCADTASICDAHVRRWYFQRARVQAIRADHFLRLGSFPNVHDDRARELADMAGVRHTDVLKSLRHGNAVRIWVAAQSELNLIQKE